MVEKTYHLAPIWALLGLFNDSVTSLIIFRAVFEPFLGTVVKKAKKRIFVIFLFNPSVDIWVLKMLFHKMYILLAPIESTGPGMYLLDSLKALTSRGIDNLSCVRILEP